MNELQNNLSFVQSIWNTNARSFVVRTPTTLLYWLTVAVIICYPTKLVPEVTTADIEYLVDRAFKTTANNSFEKCAYTVRTTDGTGSEKQERFDPYFGDEQAWSLVSTNGTAPTAKQLDGYEPSESLRHPAVLSFDFIDTSTLKFVAQESNDLRFSFELASELRFENDTLIANTVVIEPVSAQIKEIRRASSEAFRVAKFAKVLEFEAIDRFRYEDETKALVLQSSSVRLKARSGEYRVDQSIQRAYSEFDCSTTPIEVPPTNQENPSEEEFDLFIESEPNTLDP
ncbi:MAG: hypothetical protein OXG24_09585 [Gammaproteobacteria bacterium]|nr:hypothetical protein [Gammaproteobacteria bacterium]